MSVEVGVEEVVVEVLTPSYGVEVSVVNPLVEVIASGSTTIDVSVVDAAVSVTSPSNVIEVSTPANVVDVILSGPPGKEGTIILNGQGPPTSDLGNDGYYYLDTLDDVLWGPKTDGQWPVGLDPLEEVINHELDPNPHPQYLLETHLTDSNPHPQYLPTTHLTDPNPHPQYLTAVPIYTHTQGVLSKLWNIRHNLGRHPNVVVEDAAGSTIYGTVIYVDTNVLTIAFSSSATGHAHCS
jgi:hypothetical protein